MEESYNTYEKVLINRAFQKGIPLSASFELSPLCNMNCQMCYVRLSESEMSKKGQLRTAKEWLFLAEQMKEAGTLFVMLTGGEPLLYPEFKKVYLGLRNLGMIVTVNTNGTLLNEEWADFFAENPPRRINITLYGSDQETYKKLCGYEAGYEKALNAIKLLLDRKIAVKINGSLVQANEMQIDELVKTAEQFKTAINIDTYMYPAKRERSKPFDKQSRLSPEEAAEAKLHFLKLTMKDQDFCNLCQRSLLSVNQEMLNSGSRKMHCQAGRTSFAVNWQGHLQPCVMLKEISFPVFEIGVKTAWKKLRDAVEAVELSEECSVCKYRAVCHTCAACAFHEAGNFGSTPEYMCQYTKSYLHGMIAESESDQSTV